MANPIVPAGTDVFVKLTNSSSAGRMASRSWLTLQLARLDFQGKSYALSSGRLPRCWQVARQAHGRERSVPARLSVAVLGGILGGGKGAAIGAGVGGGGSAAAEAATKGQQVRIPSETKLDFNLQQPVTVTYSPDKNSSNR